MVRLLSLALVLLPSVALAQSVEVTIDTAHPGKALPATFLGVSCEERQLLAAADGTHTFSPENKPLLAEFRSLGIQHLRIGGSTTDMAGEPRPSMKDLDALFGFARAAHVKVLYTLRIKNADIPAEAAAAAYIQRHYPESIDAFVIGNEASSIGFKWDSYHDQWLRIAQAVVRKAPHARFAGPGTNPNAAWNKQFIQEFAPRFPIACLTDHLYPGGCAYKVFTPHVHYPSPEYDRLVPQDGPASRDKLLDPAIYKTYDKTLQKIRPAIEGTSIPYRLEETNSLWYGGLKGTSNAFAATLWGLDYLTWWENHDAAGLDFHTGDMVAGPIPCYYAVFQSSAGGYVTRPLGYALKTFALTGQGREVPVTIASSENLNLSAIAFLDKEHMLRLLLVNKAHAADSPTLHVQLHTPATITSAESIALTAPSGDISATDNLTLGGAPIGPNGEWKGQFAATSPDDLTLPPASALLLQARIAP